MLFPSRSKSFTLLELLIVIGIIAVLSTALIMVIRPAEQFRKGRDSSRVSQLDSLRTALNMALMENVSLGEDHTVYLSLPSNDPSCSDLSLPPLPNLWTYHCSNSQNFRKIDGTGWIPINFTQLVTVNLPALPIDPINNTTYYFTYTTGGSYELTALLESSERHDPAINDGDAFPGLYAVGTSLNLTPRTRDLGLVGYWKMDESSWTDNCSTLTVQDSSGHGNHGKACPNGYGPVTASGKVGNAGSFDGTDDYVDCGNDASLNYFEKGLTVEAWGMQTESTGGSDSWLLDKDYTGYRIWGIDMLTFWVRTPPALNWKYVAGPTLEYNKWYHVVGVVDNVNYKIYIYVNGVRYGPTSLGEHYNFSYANYYLRLGRRSAASQFWPGLIDDVRIYNRALSAEEIQAIYNATK
jgi:type II secretory pathway pseudopilin PulG